MRRLPQVAIMTPDMASYQAVEDATAYSQEHENIHPVTLLATSNGTHIAVQVGQIRPGVELSSRPRALD